MNMYSNDYLQNQIATASKEQLLIMFYDGAIRFLAQARLGIENNDITGRTYGINKASAIISELSATLDHKIGGKVAEDLDALYAYMLNELTMANMKNDGDRLETVITMLADLRKTWLEAIQIQREERHGITANTPRAPHQSLSVAM